MIVALGAVALSAEAGPPCGVAAVGALHEQLAGLGCPTSGDGVGGAQMTGQKM